MKRFFIIVLSMATLNALGQEETRQLKHSITIGYGNDLRVNSGGHGLCQYRLSIGEKMDLNFGFLSVYQRERNSIPSRFKLDETNEIRRRQYATNDRNMLRTGIMFKIHKHINIGGDLIFGMNDRLSYIEDQVFTFDSLSENNNYNYEKTRGLDYSQEMLYPADIASVSFQNAYTNSYRSTIGKFTQITFGVGFNAEVVVPLFRKFDAVFSWHPYLIVDKNINENIFYNGIGGTSENYDAAITLSHFGNVSLRFNL